MAPRVLIVHGSLAVRMNLSDAFRAAGWTTLVASDAAQARSLVALEPLDALLLEPSLPDGDGLEIVREVRETEHGKDFTIAMLSEAAEPRIRARASALGADAFLDPPYDGINVIERVSKLVRSRERRAVTSAPVLVIYDDASFRSELAGALAAHGYEVVQAASGEDGLRLAAAERPCVIVVGGTLPGFDGTTMIRRVRLDAELRAVPCVLLATASDTDAESRALDSGADAFVCKDDDVAPLVERLGALLRGVRDGAPASDTASQAAARKILVVDDSAAYVAQLTKALQSEGYEIIVAGSGEEAIELLSVQSVDCILLDLILKGLSGTETCRLFKSSPGLRDVPVIVLTAEEDRSAMLEGLAMDADDYIPKSPEFTVLKARLRAQLRRRQFEDETRRMREQLLRSQIEAATARTARELAETRAQLVEALERKNAELQTAYRELQATQAQLVHSAKMASLGELVAGVAHEINNPLAFVLSHLDTTRRSLTKAGPDPTHMTQTAREHWERAQSRLSEMHLGLERIRELVVKLRTFSRLDEGERKTVSIRECVESLLTILHHKLKDRISVETHYGEPDRLECYPGVLTQAIMNLVSNSIDAIDGSGRIGIRTGGTADTFEIVVTDTGHGIPLPLRERVMEPFFTTKPVGQGTGLGLSIAYSIVRKHDGTLELGDADGGGTSATIRIPRHS